MKEKQNIIPKISNFSISRLKEKSFFKKKKKKIFYPYAHPSTEGLTLFFIYDNRYFLFKNIEHHHIITK